MTPGEIIEDLEILVHGTPEERREWLRTTGRQWAISAARSGLSLALLGAVVAIIPLGVAIIIARELRWAIEDHLATRRRRTQQAEDDRL